jgi:protein-L-isoaspartate(D-aspartate) O-methyltransferase
MERISAALLTPDMCVEQVIIERWGSWRNDKMSRVDWSFAAALVPVLSRSAHAQTAQFEQARHELVDKVLVPSGLTNKRVVQAMRDTPRHEFVAFSLRKQAYLDMALPIGDQQTISSPLIVSQMTQALEPQPGDKVLEIGTGSGYRRPLSPLVRDVYTIEIVEEFGDSAKGSNGWATTTCMKVGDGYLGWPEHVPPDKIIVTCRPRKFRSRWWINWPTADEVVPVGERIRTLYLLRKKGTSSNRSGLPTLFVPMTGKAEDARAVGRPGQPWPTVAEEDAAKSRTRSRGGTTNGWQIDERPDGKHYVRRGVRLDGHLCKARLDGRQEAAQAPAG